jgi:outer membrane protein assembly factor BamA
MYNRIFYKYGMVDPGTSFAYNIDDGLFLGVDFKHTSHGFRKEPFAVRQDFAAGYALRTGSMYFRYLGEFTRLIGNSDLVVRGDFRVPINVTNFFGLGNETRFTQDLGAPYFRARYNIINASVVLRRQLQSWMRVYAGPAFQYFKVPFNENESKYLGEVPLNGLDPATLYTPKSYLGGEFGLEINSRNSRAVPTRGFTLDAGVRQLFGMNPNSRNLTQLRWDMSVIASFVPKARLVIASRLGWYHNLGHYEFAQANYLSGPDNLRGYRRNRFGGRTMLFNNTELRVKLGDINTYLFPGSLGLLFFHDIGRVWQDNESSNIWHNGFGAGFWIAPVQRFVITISAARSTEEKLLPIINFGFAF